MIFDDYIEANTAFWNKHTPPEARLSEDAILVDFLSPHPGYIIGTATVAKYLQIISNKKLVAVLPGRADADAARWASSFILDGILYLEDAPRVPLNPSPAELFPTSPSDQWRKSFLTYSIDDIQLGDLAYDHHLRNTGLGTIERPDSSLLALLQQAVDYFRFFRDAIRQNRITTTVQGHIVYTTFGTLARAAVKEGAEVFARKFSAGPFTVRKYNDAAGLKNHEFRFTEEEFDYYYAHHGVQFARLAEPLLEKRVRGIAVAGDGSNAESYGSHKRNFSRDAMQLRTGIDPDKPCVCIMSHVFPDAPHSYESMLYDDYFEWLTATLAIVKDIPRVNWLVKSHPDNRHYNSKHSAVEETLPYTRRYPHIKLVPDDVNTSSLFGLVDAIVTVSGTAGIEFTCMGIPCLCAGVAAYTGHGFTIDVRSEPEYRRALETVGFHGRLSDEQIQRARAFAHLYFSHARVKSCLVPDMPGTFWAELDRDRVFSDAINALERYSIEDDPLFEHLKTQVAMDLPHLMNFGPPAPVKKLRYV